MLALKLMIGQTKKITINKNDNIVKVQRKGEQKYDIKIIER